VPKEPGLPTLTEEAIDNVVQGLANDIEFITDSFMPDGKKFRQDTMSDDESLDAYLAAGLHDNPEAAANMIRQNVIKITGKLASYGIPMELWPSSHPYDIAQAAAIKLSYKMENLLREREAKTATTPVEFPAEDTPDGGNRRLGY
jgi:hypothetical protein